jgi:hypothetical protein
MPVATYRRPGELPACASDRRQGGQAPHLRNDPAWSSSRRDPSTAGQSASACRRPPCASRTWNWIPVSVFFSVGRSASFTGFDEHQPLPEPEVEDRVHGVDVVADRLDRERPSLRRDVSLDVLGPHAVDRLAGEERCDVVPQIRRDGEPVRLAPALQLESLAELSALRTAVGPDRRPGYVAYVASAGWPTGGRWSSISRRAIAFARLAASR